MNNLKTEPQTPMAKNFTLQNPLNVPYMHPAGYNLKRVRTSPLNASPSESVIRNLMNYSKALTVIPDRIQGHFNLILLN